MTENDVEKLMAVPERAVDSESALARIRARIDREGITPKPRTVLLPVGGRWDSVLASMWTKTAAAAAAIVIALALLTVSGVAETIITLFEPKQVVAVPITRADLTTGAVGFQTYGTLTWSSPPRPYDVPNRAEAEKASGMKVLTPSDLPPGTSSAGDPKA